MPLDIHRLKQEYQALRSERQATEEPVWDDIEKFIMPLTGSTAQALEKATADGKTSLQLWDLTAPLALEHLASALHSDVTSPAARWIDFEWDDAEVEADLEARKHREKLAELVWAELQASDFGMEMAAGYLEYAGLGNVCLVVEPSGSGLEWRGLDFTAVPIRQVQFVEDSKGGVLRWYRHLQWTPVQIVDHCARSTGPDGKPCVAPERIVKMAQAAGGATRKLDVVFCVLRRNGDFGTKKIPEEVEGDVVAELRPFASVYFTLDEGEQLGAEGGYYKMPAVMGRWQKRPGSQWGFGRGHIALRHVKWLNAYKELQRNAAEKAVDPAHGVSERVGQPIDLRPGKTNVLPSKEDWWPLEGSARFDVSAEAMADERLEIRRAFHEDDLQLKDSPQMTAYEVQARKDQMNRGIGSPVARLTVDVLQPMAMNTLDALGRAKKLPDAPEIVRRKRPGVRLRLRGPIARAQLLDQVVAIERGAAFIANLVKLGFPQARHYLNLGQTIAEHFRLLGMPAAAQRSEAEARRLIEAEEQMLAQAQAAKTAKDSAQAMAAAASAGSGVPIAPQPALVPSGGIPA